MSVPPKPERGPLAQAAALFDEELRRYQKITDELRRTPVRSEKTLARTKRLLGESAECERELGAHLQSLLQAMNGAREAQQSCMQETLDAAQAVQKRAEELTSLLERVAALGQHARDVSGPVAKVMAEKASGASADTLAHGLDDVSTQMQSVVSEAESVLRTAEDGDWPDVAKDVRALKQQIEHARAKVIQARKDLAASMVS